MIDLKIIPKTSGIYKFTNKTNNKCYIGQAINLKRRISGHINVVNNQKNNSYFYKSIRKHGLENFEVEILQEGNFTNDELNQMEIRFIELFKSINPKLGYNLTNGGLGSSGFKHTEEHKQRLSKIHKGKIVSEETKAKMSKFQKGKIVTKEQIEKIKETKRKNGTLNKTDYKHTQETLDKIRETKIKNGTFSKTWNKGKKMTEEQKNKANQTKLKNGTSRKGKENNWNKGKKYAPEEKYIIVKKIKQTKDFNKNMKLIQENNFIYDWLF